MDENFMNYSVIFDIERGFDFAEAKDWTRERLPLTVYSSLVYVVAIFAIQSYMKSRPPFGLRAPLATWNFLLAAFSFCGVLRTVPELVHSISTYGYPYTVCNDAVRHGITGFWTFLFVVSKLVELGDTLFIVLRRGRLIFLHWYHHITVLMYAFYCYADGNAAARWFVCCNFTVHTIMYTYYGLVAIRIRPPRWVSMVITSMQLLQFFVCFGASLYQYHLIKKGVPCTGTHKSLYTSFVLLVTYIVFFGNFFYQRYCREPSLKARKLQ
ncbi:PREDICTED: putative fatty acid elongation protein 3 [Priapulus caudatus]|uniref:Elongation of very long chain fatty acids protein n=1 Tax=Priapulus caudatus TaxID=37621 RepID=A0ABM1EG95_PRICU|nr:PREDICTED: putative fatty acid elongation protein 3 [Priapulus caudatus]